MQIAVERLNEAIDNLQADRTPLRNVTLRDASLDMDEEIAMLRVAAMLNAMRPSAGEASHEFLSDLRARVLTAAGAAS